MYRKSAILSIASFVAVSLAAVRPVEAQFGHARPTFYGTHLTGAQEVPPNASRARGQALFALTPDGQTLHYALIVANIHNVLQAHIHVGPANANGLVVAFLFGPAAPAGRTQGVLATGAITEADLVGPLEDMNLQELVDAMNAGNTYVNVHTSQLPPGEIRGQIRRLGF